ncbi:protein kinase [Streptomyces sp. NPDC046831]|uniref:protein kinase domain-containing protein n=1 Tax=Streptomyces sp. NPDC046831 TaxID=3154805 RepID=UPI0034044A6B
MGEVFAGRYELVDPIGRGGVGAVWRAWDHRRRRYVAAKVLQQRDAHSLLRFVREQALRIDHPHVLAPASWAADDDKVLFTMDLVTGGSLVHLVGDYGPLPPVFVCTLLDQLLSGLAAVHAEGVVHRDIKPANVLLEATGTGRPRLRLSDFGIAMRLGEPRLTETNLVVGTPGYLAPEQMMGAEPDFPADLFAVGLVALYLLEGAKPDAKALVEYFTEHGTPGAPKGIPEPLWQVVAALLQPDPAARFRTATGARRALAAAAELLPEPGPDDELVEIFDQVGPLPPGFALDGPLERSPGVAVVHTGGATGSTGAARTRAAWTGAGGAARTGDLEAPRSSEERAFAPGEGEGRDAPAGAENGFAHDTGADRDTGRRDEGGTGSSGGAGSGRHGGRHGGDGVRSGREAGRQGGDGTGSGQDPVPRRLDETESGRDVGRGDGTGSAGGAESRDAVPQRGSGHDSVPRDGRHTRSHSGPESGPQSGHGAGSRGDTGRSAQPGAGGDAPLDPSRHARREPGGPARHDLDGHTPHASHDPIGHTPHAPHDPIGHTPHAPHDPIRHTPHAPHIPGGNSTGAPASPAPPLDASASPPTGPSTMSDTGSFHLPPPQATGSVPRSPAGQDGSPRPRRPEPGRPWPQHTLDAESPAAPRPGFSPPLPPEVPASPRFSPHDPTDPLPHRGSPPSHPAPTSRQDGDTSTAEYTAEVPQAPTVPHPPPERTPGRRPSRHRAARPRRPGPPRAVAVPLLLLALACYAVGLWALTRL